MNTKPALIFVLLILLDGAFALAQAPSPPAQVLQGAQPYTPSRLNWLATELNAYYRLSISNERQYSLTYVAVENQNTILIFVRYRPNASREQMNLDIENAKELINITAKSYGWTSWLNVKENVKMNRLNESKY